VAESDTGAGLSVHSNFILYRTRGDLERDFYVGSRQDVLRSVDGGWKIASRRILVPQNVLGAKNVSSFF
jgi:3-phenylpropionate/cinnamic acid dioxygenase small subunit